MSTVFTTTELEQLRKGDRLKYNSIQWQVKDYSTYQDPQDYKTEEWLLRSPTGIERYLLREVDPQNPETPIHWYFAEEISSPKIFLPNGFNNLVPTLLGDMRGNKTPYRELRLEYKSYYFESETKGNYQAYNWQTSRITWDYWDRPHQCNLAIEAWPDGDLHIYFSKVVNPDEFSDIEKAVVTFNRKLSLILEGIFAIFMVIFGIAFMFFG